MYVRYVRTLSSVLVCLYVMQVVHVCMYVGMLRVVCSVCFVMLFALCMLCANVM